MALWWYRKLDSDWTDSMWNSTMNSVSSVSYVQWIMWNSALIGTDASYLCNSWSNNANVFVTSNWTSIMSMVKRTTSRSSWSWTGRNWIYFMEWWWSWEVIYIGITNWDTGFYTRWWKISCSFAKWTWIWTCANFQADGVLSVWKRYHLWVNWKSDKSIQIYINWVPVWTAWTSYKAPSWFSANSNAHAIWANRNSADTNDWFAWNVDELKHYNAALSSAYIKNDASYYLWFF